MAYSNGGIFLSTDNVEPSLRNRFWQAISQPISDVLPTEADGLLRGSVLVHPVGRLTLVSAKMNRQRHIRSELIIANGGLDHYSLQLVLTGTMVADFGQGSIVAGPGDICLFDLTRPYTNLVEAGERITIAAPREQIDRAIGGGSVHGLLLRSDAPLTYLLRSLMLNLHKRASQIDKADISTAETATIDFIAAIIAGQARDLLSNETVVERNLRQHILGFIDAHLSDPELGTTTLMSQFQISRAHLYRVFAADGGIATVIRERRLDLAYRLLKREGNRSGAITQVAFELGFASSGQFSRAFRSRFGVAPSQVTPAYTAAILGDNGWTLLQSHFARLAKCWSTARTMSAHTAVTE